METISALSTILPGRTASAGGKSSVSIDASIRGAIEAADPGRVFSPADFAGLGSRAAVDKALSRLAASGELRRITRGLYDRPELSSSMPSAEKIARALAGNKNGLRLQESGAYAANLLGLSESMPSKIEFMTDGVARTAWIGERQLVLKAATPRNMATAGRISGLVIQALRHLKQPHVDETVLRHLQARLTMNDKAILLEDAALAPAWIAGVMRRVADETKRAV